VKKLLQYLKDAIIQADVAATHLQISMSRCKSFIENEQFTEEQLIELEALTGRFARLSDLLIQKMLKAINQLDGSDMGTVRDRLFEAEKKEIIPSAQAFLEIRTMRNAIAHEYEFDALKDIFAFAYTQSEILIEALDKAKKYSEKFY
jgi:hypothetical protein